MGTGQMGTGQMGNVTNGHQDKWAPGQVGTRTSGHQDKWAPDKWAPDKWAPDNFMVLSSCYFVNPAYTSTAKLEPTSTDPKSRSIFALTFESMCCNFT